MTAEQAATLGIRAIAAGYRWAPGATTQFGERVYSYVDGNLSLWLPGNLSRGQAERWPDFGDPSGATLGTLIAQVRARHRMPDLALVPVDESIPLLWEFMDSGLSPIVPADLLGRAWESEAEAWVAALEVEP